MKLLLNIPIEPLEERYSNQWRKWFSDAFATEGLDVITIDPEITSGKITEGSFLDVVETNQYKLLQTFDIIEKIKIHPKETEITLFFHDLWHPGLSNIAYVRDGLKHPNIRICGCLHAGSYDQWDFLNKTGMTHWANHLENSWFGQIVNKIFVATEFHKKLLCTNRNVHPDKVIVTGFPMYADFVPVRGPKKDIIVFPHRMEEEKQPYMFNKLEREMRKESIEQHWKWYRTKEITKTKKDYYTLLSESKIAMSFALQETWGIAMQEAVLCGCYPICPNRLSYTELYPDIFLYNDLDEARTMIRKFMNFPPQKSLWTLQDKIVERGRSAIPNIIKHIQMFQL